MLILESSGLLYPLCGFAHQLTSSGPSLHALECALVLCQLAMWAVFFADDVCLERLVFCSNWILFLFLKCHVLDIAAFHFRLVALPTEQRGDSETCKTVKDCHTY